MARIVDEWLAKARRDLAEAKFLFAHRRPLDNVGFFIQQAVEKGLKGYLIAGGWELEKIHSLEKLIAECVKTDASFSQYKNPLRKITRFYFESRYPVGYEVEYTRREIKEALDVASRLLKLVEGKVG